MIAGMSGSRARLVTALVGGLVVVLGGLTACTVPAGTQEEAVAPRDASTPEPVGPAPVTPSPAGMADTPLLTVADPADGDSFVASDGVEYRVGLVNTPERGECGAAEASDLTYRLLADGFTAEAYAADDHGRQVARIMTAEGDLGVLLAARGFADDRYLEDFRQQAPDYAAELDRAFEEARRTGVGLYATCWSTQDRAAAPTAEETISGPVAHSARQGVWACHPAYEECLPDGADLDCAEVGHSVRLLGNDDPFRLDGNSTTATDGSGCDTFPAWDDTTDYPYYAGR